MIRVGKFEKVNFEQFKKDIIKVLDTTTYGIYEDIDYLSDNVLLDIYNNIELPKRSTKGSCGYDFHLPVGIRCLAINDSILIPTGIRCYIEEGWYLGVYPRSGLGTKYRVQLDNTVGIIDQDYYYSDNQGHIFIKLTNDSKECKDLELKAGDKFVQGIFNIYGITIDDDITDIRNGGFGSTGK